MDKYIIERTTNDSYTWFCLFLSLVLSVISIVVLLLYFHFQVFDPRVILILSTLAIVCILVLVSCIYRVVVRKREVLTICTDELEWNTWGLFHNNHKSCNINDIEKILFSSETSDKMYLKGGREIHLPDFIRSNLKVFCDEIKKRNPNIYIEDT